MTNNNLSREQRVAKILLEIQAVTISKNNPFRFVSGILSPIYTDNRLLMGHPLKRKEITIYMAYVMKEHNIDPEIIAGTATAGIPPAAWLAELLNLPMIYVRSKPKDHGKGKMIEGIMKKGSNVLLVEDLISLGKSSLTAVDSIKNEGGKINTCIAFFEYGFKEAREEYKKRKINLLTLTTFDSLVEMAEKLKMISNKEKKIILSWKKDPWGWENKIKATSKTEHAVEY